MSWPIWRSPYARSIGRDQLAAVLRGLANFVEGAEQ
jgi:hypothetical protein